MMSCTDVVRSTGRGQDAAPAAQVAGLLQGYARSGDGAGRFSSESSGTR